MFDPFSGTGTTALCAAYRGRTGVATDINPFLIWLAGAKARSYDPTAIAAFQHAARLAALGASNTRSPLAEPPPLANIHRWWHPAALTFLRRLKAAIAAHHAGDATLLNVAFCRTMMKLSNAAFNHQSMSFGRPAVVEAVGAAAVTAAPGDAADETASFAAQFLGDASQVAAAAADNPEGTAEYILSDARGGAGVPGSAACSTGVLGSAGVSANAGLRGSVGCDVGERVASVSDWRGRVDLLITSPPYPNRMSYIRELRPYMYWLRYLLTGRQAGELDWEAIGGTWGVATSRLVDWLPCGEFVPSGMERVLAEIRSAHAKNGPLLANYVHRYFEDMFAHLTAMLPLLKTGATVHYIVGNSIFYGYTVHAEEYLAQQMAAVGLCDVRIVPIRKRNSKRGLVEFHVAATRQG